MSLLDNGRPKRIKVGQAIDQRLVDALSQSEIEALQEEARKKVQEERAKDAKAKLLAHFMDEERASHDPAQQKVPIVLALAGHSNYIMLDGKYYYHNTLYRVTPSVYSVLKEQEARGWAHEENAGNPNQKTHRRPPHIGTANYQTPEWDDAMLSDPNRGAKMSARTGTVVNAPKVNA